MTTEIEWTKVPGYLNDTWNALGGCFKISDGCKFCYAVNEAIRMNTRVPKYAGTVTTNPPNWTGKVNFDPNLLDLPRRTRKPTVYFVNSMSDMFHETVVAEKFEWIEKMFAVMNECPQHIFQILTKRAYELEQVAHRLTWTPNIWMGVSIESSEYLWRLDHLRKVPARIRWISAEPLLGPLDGMNLEGIHWVVVGGLSGGDAPKRPQDVERLADWIRGIREQCAAEKIAFFFKQWGGAKGTKKKNGAILDGQQWHEFPSLEDEPLPELHYFQLTALDKRDDYVRYDDPAADCWQIETWYHGAEETTDIEGWDHLNGALVRVHELAQQHNVTARHYVPETSESLELPPLNEPEPDPPPAANRPEPKCKKKTEFKFYGVNKRGEMVSFTSEEAEVWIVDKITTSAAGGQRRSRIRRFEDVKDALRFMKELKQDHPEVSFFCFHAMPLIGGYWSPYGK